MSSALIRQALETRLAAMSNGLPTVWEGTVYEPTLGTPFQRATIMPSPTESPTQGGTTELVQESGILQVTLYYPFGEGMKNVMAQAERLRAWFSKGLAMTAGGVIVQVTRRASVTPCNRDGEWVMCPITIPYFSNLYV